MSDELKHECAVAMVVLRRPPSATGDLGGTKLSLLLEKQHNRGQDGAGAAILRARPVPGEVPYWIAKSASSTPLVDVLGAIGKRRISSEATPIDTRQETGDAVDASNASRLTSSTDRIFLGHLRYATFGKNDVAFCHPFIHEASDLAHTLLLAGNFNLTNAHELFEDYSRHGSFPTSKADGYLICELIAHELSSDSSRAEYADHMESTHPELHVSVCSTRFKNIAYALSNALADADGAWTLCGATGDGWAFATRDPHGIRPGFYYVDDDVVVVASERPAIQAAFDVPPEAVKELPTGQALVVSPSGEVQMAELSSAVKPPPRPCSFERIYFSRANDADIHRERKALGAALLPRILKAAAADIPDIFFSYIPNSARIAFHGLLEELFSCVFSRKERKEQKGSPTGLPTFSGFEYLNNPDNPVNHDPKNSASQRISKSNIPLPRFGEVIVKDAKFRTFIADAAARREFYKHVYDVTYGLVRAGKDTLVVLDDSIVRGNTMKNAILPMLDRLGPKRIVIASSAPPIRYPDCYGIDMSTLSELIAFRALVNLLDGERGMGNGERELRKALEKPLHDSTHNTRPNNPLASLYARFTDEQHCAEIARLLTPPGMKAEVVVVYQAIEDLRRCLSTFQPLNFSTSQPAIGDWYFTGEYPTPGGYKVLRTAVENYLSHRSGRSY